MKKLLLKVRDKTKVRDLEDICQVIYVSKFLNVVGVEIEESKINKLRKNSNIISFKENREGNFQRTRLSAS